MFKVVKRASSIVECDKCGETLVNEESDLEECPHDERDHGICLDCGDEQDPGEAIDRATDYFEGDR